MEATEQLILFTEAFLNEGPVKICPAPASRPVYRESVPDSGTKCSGWSAKYGPVGSWLKTCVERSISPSIPFAPVWRMKDTSSGRSSYLHLRLERRTGENDSSSSRQERMWPTPVQRDFKGGVSPRALLKKNGTSRMDQLCTAVLYCGLHREGPTEPTEDRISEEAAAI